MVIGRLITDEQFRAEFLAAPERTLIELRERGFELSETEMRALIKTDRNLWSRVAAALDPRLEKASFRTT
jgi:hypothetical protein